MRLPAALACLLLLACPAAAGTVAITVDDLPVFPEFGHRHRAERITADLLAGFHRAGWPVTGFVNESQLQDGDDDAPGPPLPRRIAVLKRWTDAGYELGNHTYSHASLTATPPDRYIADIARGDAVTRGLDAAIGRRERWFRHPYLETGATPAARAAVDGWLAAHGYTVAPVSMENLDWVFAEPYDREVRRGHPVRAAAIRRAYLDYTARVVAWYRQAAVAVLGREPAFIFLMHASRLNSVSIDALAAILHAQGLAPVTLDRAYADPAYRIAEHHVGPEGIPWVQRWAEALGRPLPALPPAPPAAIQRDYDAIEAADPDPRAPLPAVQPR